MTTTMQLIFTHLNGALEDARTLDRERLPKLLADLREVECTALARLSAPAPAQQPPDELLTTAQAAERLHCSKVYLYKNAHTLPFACHLGKKLLFSADGIKEYLAKQR
jgi:excisionase family DNA binding protein